MGERTVREVLKRRSDETLRKIQMRRDFKRKIKPKKKGLGWFAWLLILMLAALAAWGGWLWHRAQTAFEAHQWNVPARVYGRALELYPGSGLAASALASELDRLGYTKTASPEQAGQYALASDRIVFITRPFRFWDGEQPALKVIAQFEGGSLKSLRQDGGSELFLVRLDPPLIGSVFPVTGEDRILVTLDQVPETLRRMLLAVEDRRFYAHHGVDPKSVMRAFTANMEAGEIRQGGSTITQQLVKNFYLSPERSYIRKANEAVMALAIDASFSKDEILEAYLNEVYLGQDGERAIHGFGLGSYFYFQKPVQELKAAEMALLVGMIKGPSYFDPRKHPERAKDRRQAVLNIALEQQILMPEEASSAAQASLGVSRLPPQGTSYYPAFMDLLKEQLQVEYDPHDLTTAGLQVFSTLDPAVQLRAEKDLAEELARIESSRGLAEHTLEGAVVVTSLEGAEVQAVVGGRDARFAGFNRAMSAVRPVGSLLKPVVYLTALQRPSEFTLTTMVEDTPLEVQLPDGRIWKPENYRGVYNGSVPLFEALVNSYNVPAVRTGMRVGVNEVIRNLQLLGFGRTPNAYPSLLLGAVTMTPLEVAQVYNTLGAGGFRTPLNTIREVLGSDGMPLKRYPLEVTESADPKAVYLVNRALQWVTREGTAELAGRTLGSRVAGKTGTTDDYRDSWFAGYSGDHLAVVWLGRDDNEPVGLTGASGALPVWVRLMSGLADEAYRPVKPDGVNEVWIDTRTWKASTQDCSTARQLPFIQGSQPVNEPVCGEGVTDKLKSMFQ